MKLQPSMKSLCKAPSTKVCQRLQTWHANINGSIKNNITVNPEPLIITAQEQTLNTKKVANKIYHTVQDLRCRLCTQHAETVAHIISDCIKLAGTKYAERHNNLALIVYRVICVAYNLEHRKDWWVRPEKFVRNDDTKML